MERIIARMQEVQQKYRGKRRKESMDKCYAELTERYVDLEDNSGRWQEAAMETKDMVVEKRRENCTLDTANIILRTKVGQHEDTILTLRMELETLRMELEARDERLADIAEHYDEEYESDIPALGFLNLKEKA
jgi:chromosome segregation ATPase